MTTPWSGREEGGQKVRTDLPRTWKLRETKSLICSVIHCCPGFTLMVRYSASLQHILRQRQSYSGGLWDSRDQKLRGLRNRVSPRWLWAMGRAEEIHVERNQDSPSRASGKVVQGLLSLMPKGRWAGRGCRGCGRPERSTGLGSQGCS